jgi:hypothetical protein
MVEHTKIILKEMCKRVKAPYSKIDFKSKDWFLDYTWTEEQQEDFIIWLNKYLYNSKEAREEIMAIPQRSKESIDRVSRWFILMYGWKTN